MKNVKKQSLTFTITRMNITDMSHKNAQMAYPKLPGQFQEWVPYTKTWKEFVSIYVHKY